MSLTPRRAASAFVPLAAALALAACGDSDEGADETAYEAEAEDLSGGELIVTDPDEPAVGVELPDTPMTNVPADEADAADDAPTPAPPPE